MTSGCGVAPGFGLTQEVGRHAQFLDRISAVRKEILVTAG